MISGLGWRRGVGRGVEFHCSEDFLRHMTRSSREEQGRAAVQFWCALPSAATPLDRRAMAYGTVTLCRG
jgi:hypothetical protein